MSDSFNKNCNTPIKNWNSIKEFYLVIFILFLGIQSYASEGSFSKYFKLSDSIKEAQNSDSKHWIDTTLTTGFSCLSRLGNQGNKHIEDISDFLKDEKIPVEIVLFNNSSEEKGTLGRADKIKNSSSKVHLSKSLFEISELKILNKTLFHELFHMIGYYHTGTTEYPYSCGDCCFGEGLDPLRIDAACKLCAFPRADKFSEEESKVSRKYWMEFRANKFLYNRYLKELRKNPKSVWIYKEMQEFLLDYYFAVPLGIAFFENYSYKYNEELKLKLSKKIKWHTTLLKSNDLTEISKEIIDLFDNKVNSVPNVDSKNILDKINKLPDSFMKQELIAFTNSLFFDVIKLGDHPPPLILPMSTIPDFSGIPDFFPKIEISPIFPPPTD